MTRAERIFSLKGRRALVTGASRGIGREIAIGFAEAGAEVALCARSGDALEAVAEHVRKLGRRACAIGCDLTARKPECFDDAVESCVTQALAEMGGIDVLVNAAGGPLFQASVPDIRQSGWDRVIELNLTAVFRMCQRVGTHMVAQGSGSIINFGSVMPNKVWPAIAAYGSAKAAVLHLTQTLAVDWGAAGVRVNAICPGWTRTAINEAYLRDRERAKTAIDAVPLGHWGEAGDMVGTAIWLASDASRYVTGAIVPVDGGLSVGMSNDWMRRMRLEAG
jgi:2-deoxy-D-gluconate 3-dehydrogenase